MRCEVATRNRGHKKSRIRSGSFPPTLRREQRKIHVRNFLLLLSLNCTMVHCWTSASRRLYMATDSRELRFFGSRTITDFGSKLWEGASTSQNQVLSAMSVVASNFEQRTMVPTRPYFTSKALGGGEGGSDSQSKRNNNKNGGFPRRITPQTGYGPSIKLSDDERELFDLLRKVRHETGLHTTLRVAGGWVRDKLLATDEFQAYHKVFEVGSNNARLTSKFRMNKSQSMGRQGTKVLVNNDKDVFQPVDIDIALDDMLGREFADHLNEYLTSQGKDEVSVGMVLKNPEKSKHLETATMKVGPFWIDFVNLRAEEYTQNSRIPDLMRIGTPDEDAFRRDLTINALFFNINTGEVEDWTGRGFQDLRKGIVTTPLPPLTTLLDDPLRVLRSIRFAARLRFTMDNELIEAAKTESVGYALSQKVSRERVGGELDLMLRSPDPVGAVRLLLNLQLVHCVFPVVAYFKEIVVDQISRLENSATIPDDKLNKAVEHMSDSVFNRGMHLLTMTHDHLADCRFSPPLWCNNRKPIYGATEVRLIDDEECRRLLWYASFLKPLYDDFKIQQAHKPRVRGRSKKANRSIVAKLLVDELKRPGRDAEAVERIMKAADDFRQLLNSGCDVSATMILLSDIHVTYATSTSSGIDEICDLELCSCSEGNLVSSMNGRKIDSSIEEDPLWEHAMEFRLLCSKVLQRVGNLWRAALFLAISEDLSKFEKSDGIEYAIEGDVFDESNEERRQGVIERYDVFAAALQQIGLIGIWHEKPVANGEVIRKILPRIPTGPGFREVMDEQTDWMVSHPGAGVDALANHLKNVFPEYHADPAPEQ